MCHGSGMKSKCGGGSKKSRGREAFDTEGGSIDGGEEK